MENKINFKLSNKTVENLEAYSTLLNKDINTILEESLEQYFDKANEQLLTTQALESENGATNLDYNEFWDDIDID